MHKGTTSLNPEGGKKKGRGGGRGEWARDVEGEGERLQILLSIGSCYLGFRSADSFWRRLDCFY